MALELSLLGENEQFNDFLFFEPLTIKIVESAGCGKEAHGHFWCLKEKNKKK